MTPRTSLVLAVLMVGALGLAACDFDQVVDVDVPEEPPRLVVGGFLAADSVFSLRLGRSVPALAPEDPFGEDGTRRRVTDATVRILAADGGLVAELAHVGGAPGPEGLPYERGTYRAVNGATARAGETYTLRAEAPGLPAVVATTRLPAVVPVEVTEVGDEGEGDGFSPPTFAATLRWDDPEGDDVYRVRVRLTVRDGDSLLFRGPRDFFSSDPFLRASFGALDGDEIDLDGDDGGERFYGDGALLRDSFFDGGSRSLRLRVFWDRFEPPVTGAYEVVLERLSEPFVRYAQSRDLQDDSEANPFAEPLELFSNVEGGLGVFAGLTRSAAEVDRGAAGTGD